MDSQSLGMYDSVVFQMMSMKQIESYLSMAGMQCVHRAKVYEQFEPVVLGTVITQCYL